MPDDETPDTYTPRKTRFVDAEVPAPAGGTRTMTFRLQAGQTYEVVPEEEAQERLGYAPGSNLTGLIRESVRNSI